MMLNPATSMLLPQLSPTNSSVSSSSDLDTESTGSFFHDRSTTLGTLMGVTCPSITFRAPSQHRDQLPSSFSAAAPAGNGGGSAILTRRRKRRDGEGERRRTGTRRRWWSLCRDGEAKPSSLGEFLEVERRFGDVEVGTAVPARALFADGRVLPPSDVGDVASSLSPAADGALCRFPVSIAGICCNGSAG